MYKKLKEFMGVKVAVPRGVLAAALFLIAALGYGAFQHVF